MGGVSWKEIDAKWMFSVVNTICVSYAFYKVTICGGLQLVKQKYDV